MEKGLLFVNSLQDEILRREDQAQLTFLGLVMDLVTVIGNKVPSGGLVLSGPGEHTVR
jgi:hypothetical protein